MVLNIKVVRTILTSVTVRGLRDCLGVFSVMAGIMPPPERGIEGKSMRAVVAIGILLATFMVAEVRDTVFQRRAPLRFGYRGELKRYREH